MMTKICDFNTVESAAIARGMLDSYGINAVVGGEGALSELFPPGLGNAGVPLYVDEKDADRARKLLSEHGDM